MDNKLSTEEVLQWLMKYYVEKGIASHEYDWSMLKKYKNLAGLTCRDFTNQALNLRCIVVVNHDNAMQVIEGENHAYFLKNKPLQKILYYAPFVGNDGLVFYFEPMEHIERIGRPVGDIGKTKKFLEKKLAQLFGEEKFFSIPDKLYFSFPFIDLEDIVGKLENNQCQFNEKLFSLLDLTGCAPIIPDTTIIQQETCQDYKMDMEQIIAQIFAITSAKRRLSNEDYSKLRQLLHRVSHEEFSTVLKIALGFKHSKDNNVLLLFEQEQNRRKSHQLAQRIWKLKAQK